MCIRDRYRAQPRKFVYFIIDKSIEKTLNYDFLTRYCFGKLTMLTRCNSGMTLKSDQYIDRTHHTSEYKVSYMDRKRVGNSDRSFVRSFFYVHLFGLILIVIFADLYRKAHFIAEKSDSKLME